MTAQNMQAGRSIMNNLPIVMIYYLIYPNINMNNFPIVMIYINMNNLSIVALIQRICGERSIYIQLLGGQQRALTRRAQVQRVLRSQGFCRTGRWYPTRFGISWRVPWGRCDTFHSDVAAVAQGKLVSPKGIHHQILMLLCTELGYYWIG